MDVLAAREPAKPVLFVHIPKTAGTSFLLMLQNVFGDARVRRLKNIDEKTEAEIDFIVENELEGLSCLTGHLPLRMLVKHLDRFRCFTVLREPVGRVLSLFRFTMASGAENLRRLDLPADASLSQFLHSRNPEIFEQVVNGMTRQLSGNRRIADVSDSSFWEVDAVADLLESAVTHLEAMDFGLAEDLAGTLAIARRCWNIPYPLREYRENRTVDDDARHSPADLQEIARLNTLDVALYHKARALFRERLRAVEDNTPPRAVESPAVFSPPLNVTLSVADIAGRQGFDEVERDGFAWLRPDGPAQLWLRLPAAYLTVELKLYCVVPNYPAELIQLYLDGSPLEVEFHFNNLHWGVLRAQIVGATEKLQLIEAVAPRFVSVQSFSPESSDKRRLSVALANITLIPKF